MHTDGIFRCEVSAEAPSFQTVRKEKEMRVYCKLGDVFLYNETFNWLLFLIVLSK